MNTLLVVVLKPDYVITVQCSTPGLLTCSRSNCTRPSMAMTLLTLFPYALDSNVLSFMVVWEWYTRPRKGKQVTLGGKGEHHRYVYMHSNIVSVAQHCSTKREGSGDLS